MEFKSDLDAINAKIQILKRTAAELREMVTGFPALDRNLVRIFASLKMLEINISDVVAFEIEK